MYKRIKTISILLASIILFGSCQYFTQMNYKEWLKSSSLNNDIDIYIGGYYSDGTNNYPCYWKNESLVTLECEDTSSYLANGLNQVKSISFDGDDIYCGGWNIS